MAFTKRSPPLLNRTAAAIFLATSSLSVARLMLYAMSGPDGRGAAAGVRGGRPEIWAPLSLLHLDRETFEFAAPDVFEVAP
jgi:hypothetical protein